MKSQLQVRFGLSQKSAGKIATVAHQYNKLADSRALTSEDVSSFTKELVNYDMNQVSSSVLAQLQGNDKPMKDMVNSFSKALGEKPETVNRMIKEIFY